MELRYFGGNTFERRGARISEGFHVYLADLLGKLIPEHRLAERVDLDHRVDVGPAGVRPPAQPHV